MTEKQFIATVVETAKIAGWRVYHTFLSKRSQPGFPDLVLVRDWVVFIELKGEQTKVTQEQSAWLEALRQAGAETYLWRPNQWPEIERTLGRRAA